jgi:DUF1680 family protein
MSSNWQINRRKFIQSAALSAWSLQSALRSFGAVDAAAKPQPGLLDEFSYGSVKLASGRQQAQLDDTMAILLNLSEDSLLKPFRLRAGLPAPGDDLGGWYDEDAAYDFRTKNEHGFAPGHCFGQWISAFCRAHAIDGSEQMKNKAERLITLYEKTISPKFYQDFRWPTYTYDKLNLALIDAHKYLGLKNAFAILDKTTDVAEPFFPGRALDHDEMRQRPHKDESYCWDESYTLPENLFIAYNRGAGERYRKLAAQYLKDDTYFNPLSEGKNVLPNHHAYSYTNALSSAMQAYLTLGSEKHLQAAKNAFEMIRSTQSYATGGWGPDETFRDPNSDDMADSLKTMHHSFETPCGSYAHFKLTRYLLRVTRDSRYGDSMESVMYNTVLGAKKLQTDGRAFYYSDYTFTGKKDYRDKWTCCSGTLPQVATDYRICSYFKGSNGEILVNLYIPSTLTWSNPEEKNTSVSSAKNPGQNSLTQSGNYPFDEQIDFVLALSKSVNFVMSFRIPEWAEGAALLVNGSPVLASDVIAEAMPGKFASIKREWQNGDKITLELPLKLRLQAINVKHPELVALLRGPLVLFPLVDSKPIATKAELLASKRSAKEEWSCETETGTLRLLPFTNINDEQYSTYFELKS